MNNKKGYVTFADILGWKGIWKIKNNPVEELLSIRDEVNEYIKEILFKYEINIIESKFNQYYSDDIQRKTKVGGRIDIEKEILSNIKNIAESTNFKKEFNKLKVYINLELISDTFVITSYSEEFKKETFIHTRISQQLINSCLKHQLLIRGATSYGEYYKDNLVFVGPAIDDAASWHELSEEIGIYFTPKALLSMNNNNIVKENFKEIEFYYKVDEKQPNKKLGDIVFWNSPKLKIQSFNTYMINWKDSGEYFMDAINQYGTILPDVYKKIVFSMDRLNDLKSNIKYKQESSHE